MGYEPTWRVAKDILKKAGRPMHYTSIADRVLETGRSRLGLRGITPNNSMGMILREYSRHFCRIGHGYYDLRSRTLSTTLSIPNEDFLSISQLLFTKLELFSKHHAWKQEIKASSSGFRVSCQLTFEAEVEVPLWNRIQDSLTDELRARKIEPAFDFR